MHWYEKLNQYFPIEEMKSRRHMETLLRERGDVYHKDEGPHHVLMYAEFDDFVFIDYIFVAPEARGQGLGRRLIEELKAKGKPILLEVEPLDYDDSDSEKRLRFYDREGFRHARRIGYRRRSLATDRVNPLEIYFWAPAPTPEHAIFDKMCRMYRAVHTYRDVDFYGRAYQPTEEVLSFDARRAPRVAA